MLLICGKKRWMKLEQDISLIKSEMTLIKDVCVKESHVLDHTKENLDNWNSENLVRFEKNKIEIDEKFAEIIQNINKSNSIMEKTVEKNAKIVSDRISESRQISIMELKKLEQQINDLDLTTKIALLQNVIQNIDIVSNNGDR